MREHFKIFFLCPKFKTRHKNTFSKNRKVMVFYAYVSIQEEK